MQRNSSRKIKTFNVGFYESEYDESNFARLMAKTIGTEHYQIKLKVDDMLNHIENIVKIIDEPFSDSSIIPTYLISKLASSKVKIVLSEMVEMKFLWDIIDIYLHVKFQT